MNWTKIYIWLYLDDELLNEIDLTKSLNADGSNPFHQAHYILLNLAIGAHGGNPANTSFPRKYEVDYVRVYQKNNINAYKQTTPINNSVSKPYTATLNVYTLLYENKNL